MLDDAGFSADHSCDDGVTPPIWIDAEDWIEADLPPRKWIARGYFLRGAVTAVIGPPGVSKSSLMLACAAAAALGRPLHGMTPTRPCRVMLLNAEDDRHEQRRRLSGVLRTFGKRPEDIAGNIIRVGAAGAATLLTRCPDGELESTPAFVALEAAIALHRPDLLVLDPFSELHADEENANVQMREVVARLRQLAVKYDLALVIVHHTRKGAAVAGDMDAARGASSVVGAARIVLTVAGMTEDDAKAFGLLAGSHKHFFRVDGAKSNYATLSDAEWFERQQHQLDNGDLVAVPVPWTPPEDLITTEVQAKVEAAIRRGHPTGPLSAQLGNTDRSVRHAMIEAGITTQTGQKTMLAELYKAGFMQVRFRDIRRKWANGLRSPDGLPSAVWEHEMEASDDE